MQQSSALRFSDAGSTTAQRWGVVEVDYNLTLDDIICSGAYKVHHTGFDALASSGELRAPKRGRMSISIASFIPVGQRWTSDSVLGKSRETGDPIDLWALHAICLANTTIHLPVGAAALATVAMFSGPWIPYVKPADGGGRCLWLAKCGVFPIGMRILRELREA